MDDELARLSATLGAACRQHQLTIATAESCTGGWVAQVITHTAGSSAWFERGFVTYSNLAKIDMLSVNRATLDTHGAVSVETALEMANGALTHSQAHISLAITGIAGPGGGSPGKPVGTVCFAWCRANAPVISETQCFPGDREAIRRQAVVHSLHGLLALLETAKTVP